MKKTLLIVAALAVFATAAQAQLGTGGTAGRTLIQNGVGDWTATIATGTAVTSTTTIIDCTKQKEVCLQWRQTATTGSGTADNTMVVQASVDRVNWVTAWTPVLAPSGTAGTFTQMQTNISVGAIPYIRVYSITTGANTVALTNYSVKYGMK